jgi:hypothetical protein
MTVVFVSYARKDRARIEPLVRYVSGLVDEVWWDDRLVAGESFTEETERRLNEADRVLVVWTANSVRSKWVLDEAAVGRDADKLVPVSLDGQLPPLGFRHVHCTDFSDWRGEADVKCAIALKAALTGAASRPPPTPSERAGALDAAQRRRLWLLAFGVLAICGVALVGGLGVGLVSILSQRAQDKPSIAAATADLIAGRTPDDPEAAAAKLAVEAIRGSDRAEDRAALSSFAAGDQERALDILEKLAVDLERSGDKRAAAETYTRVGAIALLSDQARGLAARRKAIELSPESLPAFQGLFFDLYLMRGYSTAVSFAEEVVARPGVSERMKGFAYAHLAIVATDSLRDETLAEENIARVRAIAARSSDPLLETAAHYAQATLDWRRDRLADAENAANAAKAIKLEGPAVFPAEVIMARIRYAQGDWEEAFNIGFENLERRRKSVMFLPTPLVQITCFSGLYIGEVARAAPYCESQEGRTDPTGGAGFRIVAGELALARGDVDRARSELAASRALGGGGDAGSAGEPARIAAAQLRLEAGITAAEGKFDDAQSLIWRYNDAVAGEPNARSLKAAALRRLAMWAIAAGAPERACDPLESSGELYAEISGRAGAQAVAALRRKAACG